MKTYKKENKCAKCGHLEAHDVFIDKGKYYFEYEGNLRTWLPAKQELIQRTCYNCNYVWSETPIDKGLI